MQLSKEKEEEAQKKNCSSSLAFVLLTKGEIGCKQSFIVFVVDDCFVVVIEFEPFECIVFHLEGHF